MYLFFAIFVDNIAKIVYNKIRIKVATYRKRRKEKMTRTEMLEKIKELFKMVDELTDYGLYSYEEEKEIKDGTFKNLERIWGK